jgi:lysophospholipase L1-like esterase
MEGTFVAIGDSFTEGLDDPHPDGGYRGWADRFAEMAAAHNPDFRYANLAIRGRLLREVVEGQMPEAIAMRPDLVSIAAGGNDLLRPGSDPDKLAAEFEDAVERLQEAGCRVLMFTGFDPIVFPFIRLVRGKAAAYNMHLRAIADSSGCDLVDMWAMRILCDRRAWGADRLHLAPQAHHRVALRTCEVLGVPVAEDWRSPYPSPAPLPEWLSARREDLDWVRAYAWPWIQRRLQRTSSGTGRAAKRPDLLPVTPLGTATQRP